MRMLKAGMLALLLASVGAQAGHRFAVQAAGESVITMRVDGELAIGPEGQVLEYKLRTPLDAHLQQLLAKAIPAWEMVPVQRGGRAVSVRTPMRITLAASEVADGYEVRIDNVVFGPLTKEDHEAARASERAAAEAGETIAPVDESPQAPVLISAQGLQGPRYPYRLVEAGIEGIVLLNLRLNPDGTVAEVFAAQSSLLNVTGRSKALDSARALLERESARVAWQWTFIVETKDPAALDDVALTVAIPMEYRLAAHGKAEEEPFVGGWRHEFRGPSLPIPWLHARPDEQVVGVSDLVGGEQVSGSTPFRLADRSVLDQAL